MNAPAQGGFRFPREARLKKGGDVRGVFRKGRSFGCRGAKLFVLENGLGRNRICFSFPRGFGTAVRRNRARRLGREAFRALRCGLVCGYDMVLLVYPEDPGVGLVDRLGQMRKLFDRAGLAGRER